MQVLYMLTAMLTALNLALSLQRARDAGIQNILALRGDPPIGQEAWVPQPGGLSNALQLVELIRAEHGDYFWYVRANSCRTTLFAHLGTFAYAHMYSDCSSCIGMTRCLQLVALFAVQ
jgi:5,10-methylenetetrahydrofolate reductase